MQNMHMRTHTNTQMCTRTQPSLQTQNPHAHKHYFYSLAVTFTTSYVMTVSSVRSLGKKNIMHFIGFGREHAVVFK